jgi:hypothetical protein
VASNVAGSQVQSCPRYSERPRKRPFLLKPGIYRSVVTTTIGVAVACGDTPWRLLQRHTGSPRRRRFASATAQLMWLDRYSDEAAGSPGRTRSRCRDRADGRVRPSVSARLRELGLRPRLDPAELVAADRQGLAGDADGGRGAHPRAHRRCAGLARWLARLDRGNRGALRAALGLALPADELVRRSSGARAPPGARLRRYGRFTFEVIRGQQASGRWCYRESSGPLQPPASLLKGPGNGAFRLPGVAMGRAALGPRAETSIRR